MVFQEIRYFQNREEDLNLEIPSLDDNEINAVKQVFKSKFLTEGSILKMDCEGCEYESIMATSPYGIT